MADYLATYDFKLGAASQYKEFVDCAEIEGLIYVFDLGDELGRLMNTSIRGVFADRTAARAAFERARSVSERNLGRKIILEKRVITKMADVFVRSDTKKARDARCTKPTKFETCRARKKNDPFFA